MKTVAIVTWCNNNINYGQVLQAYSMQTVLNKLGYKPVIIKYRKFVQELDPTWLNFATPQIRKMYEWAFEMKKAGLPLWRTKIKFIDFENKYIKQTRQCYCKKEVEDEINRIKCKILLCGSDQIWNPGVFDPIYYLDFGDDNLLRIAYAPSIAEDEVNNRNYHIFSKMKRLIERIDAVSVREESGSKIVRELSKRQVETVLDPTFLLSPKDWDIIACSDYKKEEYILCYLLGDVRQHSKFLEAIMKKYNMTKIICIITEKKKISSDSKITIKQDVGPDKFIGLLKNAKVIYTDSFHGVAFAINYNKNFFVCRRFGLNNDCCNKETRINNILEIFKLQNRFVENVEQINACNRINYCEVNQILRKERNKAYFYLKHALIERK